MLGYVTLGTNDIEKAREFYDALLAEVGAKRVMNNERLSLWGNAPGACMLGVIKPFDQEAATIGNGTMFAIPVDSKEKVSQMHAKALELGATDEGAPGPRGERGSEFAYCRDPEGHKLAFFCF